MRNLFYYSLHIYSNGLVMGVTICANGLSVVHKGSGGEANATLPDVCLTTVGKPVVPIPYGNNAKSADLADGTTTVSVDGGNSIAIKGSKFSKSTGDAGGDKKGVASGTIEAEAEFISASATVKFEGKGVCRLSDQMTMNKANTMCLGGAQNPSVSVTEEQEGTYTVYVKVTYADGSGFKAPYKLTDSKGVNFEGVLDDNGTATISGVSNGSFDIEYGEDVREYQPNEKYIIRNPFYKKSFDPHLLIEETKIGNVGFWEAARNQATTVRNWLWGFIIGDFNKDPTTGQILLNTILGVIPGVDQVLDARDIAANILFLSEEENQDNPEAWLDLALSAIGAIPTIGSVLKGVGKAVKSDKSRDDVFALLREYGKGDVEKYLLELDWNVIKFEVLHIISETILNFTSVLDELAKKASFLGYDEYATEIDSFKNQVEKVEMKAQQHIPDALKFLEDKVDLSLRRGKSKSNVGSHSDKGSAEAGSHDDKVSQDKMQKQLDECWLCEKNIGNKKPKSSSATYCDNNGSKGKYYDKRDKEFGFTNRGTSENGHYPWKLLKAHNKRSNASPMQHPLYARCYDKTEDGRNYIRPQQIWNKHDALIAFEELKSLGATDREEIEGLEKNLQAHHIIPIDEIGNNTFLFKKLPFLGYDVNDWHNIVVLPGIPELACFYEMPLHTGPHPSAYTKNVKRQLQDLSQDIKDSIFCDESGFNAAEEIVRTMEQISLDVYKQIISFNRDGALNKKNYDIYKTGKKGCCNMLKHADIDANCSPCRHRRLAKEDPSEHHDFRTTKNGTLKRILYSGTKVSKLGY